MYAVMHLAGLKGRSAVSGQMVRQLEQGGEAVLCIVSTSRSSHTVALYACKELEALSGWSNDCNSPE